MKLIHNTGTDCVIDMIRQNLKRGSQLGCVTPTFSLFAFAELIESLTGSFKDANSPEQAAARRQGLQDCQRLELEAVGLRAKAAKEKQLARQVELNLALKRVLAQRAAVREQL